MTPTQRLFITRLARDGFHARRTTGGGAHPSSSDLTENDGTFSDRSSAGAKQNLKGTEDLLWTIATMGESVSGRATVTVHITATSSRSGVGRRYRKSGRGWSLSCGTLRRYRKTASVCISDTRDALVPVSLQPRRPRHRGQRWRSRSTVPMPANSILNARTSQSHLRQIPSAGHQN